MLVGFNEADKSALVQEVGNSTVWMMLIGI